MASARIHEAIAKEINNEYGMDEILLRIGTVSPDCWRNVKDDSGVKDKYLTHFWDFRIKDGQANDYDEFYFKYYNHLSNPFLFRLFNTSNGRSVLENKCRYQVQSTRKWDRWL